MFDIFSAIIALLVTLGSIVLLRPLAVRLGLVDAPNSRKQHQGDIPLIGGLAMFMGFSASLLTLPVALGHYRSFIAGSALLVFTGLLDDFHELSPNSRFLAQILALCLMFFWGGVKLTCLGNLLFYKPLTLGFLGLPATVIAGLGIINAINMTDGSDGLAGTLVLVEATLLLYCAIIAGQWLSVQLLLLLMSVILVFLWFNFRFPGHSHVRVFMGDAGSLFLGFSLIWFLVELSQTGTHAVTAVTMLWIMSVPLFDTTAVMLYRLGEKRSIFSPDRQHCHHLLAEVGFSPTQISMILGGANLLLGLLGLAAYQCRCSESFLFIGFLVLFVAYFWGISYLRALLSNKRNSIVFVRLLGKN